MMSFAGSAVTRAAGVVTGMAPSTVSFAAEFLAAGSSASPLVTRVEVPRHRRNLAFPARPPRAERQAAAVLFGDDLPAAESVARSPCRRAVRDGTPDRAAALRLNRSGVLERLRLRRLRHRCPSAADHPAMASVTQPEQPPANPARFSYGLTRPPRSTPDHCSSRFPPGR